MKTTGQKDLKAARQHDEILEALAQAGEVTRARRRKAGWAWKPRGLRLPPGTARRLLDWLRAERV